MDKHIEIERSIIKKYRKGIWNKFIGALKDYELIAPHDKIAVCISGGKDSFVLALCLRCLQRYSKMPFELEYLCMDPGYLPKNRALIEKNAAIMQIPLRFFSTDIFDTVTDVKGGSPCYVCARMRRGFLYKEAKALGCNKIALGHHFDDAIETVLMSMLYAGELKGMMPKLHSEHYEGMELIRPLYLVREDDIIRWKNYNNLEFLGCACRFTEGLKQGTHTSARSDVKALIKTLSSHNSQVPANILAATHSVHSATMPGIVVNGEKHSFLEKY